MSISNRKSISNQKYEKSISNRIVYTNWLHLTEMSIPDRNLDTKCLYLRKMSIRKVYI